ncbi:hypothetical protein JAAARDRAFT_364385 [Jaapia argillacea MUCL 33604]|uniref:Uncharacterized protein n=1 Tax=Jaapia argillacea MUCL 33604 TaxID=933084 RepID=A0A067QHQ3_9AGAM|nr:hypothetical protein JAAARDRAFT_364385 [Jaapia argillacea MUCL 33604]
MRRPLSYGSRVFSRISSKHQTSMTISHCDHLAWDQGDSHEKRVLKSRTSRFQAAVSPLVIIIYSTSRRECGDPVLLFEALEILSACRVGKDVVTIHDVLSLGALVVPSSSLSGHCVAFGRADFHSSFTYKLKMAIWSTQAGPVLAGEADLDTK